MLLGNRETLSDAEKEKIKMDLLPLYLNLSLTELRLDSPHKALKYGNKALEIDSANTKALFRCGQVRRDLGLFVCFSEHEIQIHTGSEVTGLNVLPGRLKIGMMNTGRSRCRCSFSTLLFAIH